MSHKKAYVMLSHFAPVGTREQRPAQPHTSTYVCLCGPRRTATTLRLDPTAVCTLPSLAQRSETTKHEARTTLTISTAQYTACPCPHTTRGDASPGHVAPPLHSSPFT